MRNGFLARIREDIRTVFDKDPAARSTIEVLLCYPGLHAVWMHRVAHVLWKRKFRLFARLVSHVSRFLTGIEIHPGARIGRRFFIDHGCGVVIGETTEIGDDVLLYQGVVLGGVSLTKGKRHPTIGDGVLIGSDTIVLGPIHIGDGARLGAASLVIHDVPAKAVAVGVPAKVKADSYDREIQTLAHDKLPDPIEEMLVSMQNRIASLEKRLEETEARLGNGKGKIDAAVAIGTTSPITQGQ